jgi:hypothetical protein
MTQQTREPLGAGSHPEDSINSRLVDKTAMIM